MAECSQKFKDMLWKYAEQLMSDCDGTHEPEADPSNVLQYVAALEAILEGDPVRVVNIPPVSITEHTYLDGPPGSKRVVAMCGACYGAVAVRGGVAWSTPDSRASELKAAEYEAVRIAVLCWLSNRLSNLEDQCPST